MFSGIVEEQGVVEGVLKKKNLYVLAIKGVKVSRGTAIGDSISVDGVCLTVTKKNGPRLEFDLMKETLDATIARYYKKGSAVNLERALKVNSRLGGHFVSGHVDGVGILKKKVLLPNYVEWQIDLHRALTKYIVPKGSVCIDGVSLTVGAVRKNSFSVYLIPHTLDVTSFGKKRVGCRMNIETDILAKYVLEQTFRSK